jgi:hypothetical protein
MFVWLPYLALPMIALRALADVNGDSLRNQSFILFHLHDTQILTTLMPHLSQ